LELDVLKKNIESESFASLVELETFVDNLSNVRLQKVGWIQRIGIAFGMSSNWGMKYKFPIAVTALIITAIVLSVILFRQVFFTTQREEEVFSIHRIGDVDLGR
jgi:hypothetical protein